MGRGWGWGDRPDAGQQPRVHGEPGGEGDDEPQAAEEPGDPVPDLLHPRAASVQLLLDLGDGLDVLLRRIGQWGR